MLPKDALKDAKLPDGSTLGPHPEYIFVAAYNRFIQDDPSHDPNAVTESLSGAPTPGGSNIGIIRDGTARRRDDADPARQRRQPRLRERVQLHVRVVPRRRDRAAAMGAVFVYNLVNLVYEVEKDLTTSSGSSRLQRFPIERVFYDPTTQRIRPERCCCRCRRTCRGSTPAIDIKADYRIIRYNGNGAQTIFGIPYVQDLNGQLPRCERRDPAVPA